MYSCTRKRCLNDCAVVYFSEIKWFWEYFGDITYIHNACCFFFTENCVLHMHIRTTHNMTFKYFTQVGNYLYSVKLKNVWNSLRFLKAFRVLHYSVRDCPVGLLHLLQPTGYVKYQQFNTQQFTFCLHCTYVFCIYLRTNSDLCHLQDKLIGFYNRDEKCLLRGTNWVFK